MVKWSKKAFVDHINKTCENDVAMICLELIDFSEKNFPMGPFAVNCLLFFSYIK